MYVVTRDGYKLPVDTSSIPDNDYMNFQQNVGLYDDSTILKIEFLYGFIKWLYYYITRPIIWVITARDCRHCKHGRLLNHGWYYSPFSWYCGLNHCPTRDACLNTTWRCKFDRRNNKR